MGLKIYIPTCLWDYCRTYFLDYWCCLMLLFFFLLPVSVHACSSRARGMIRAISGSSNYSYQIFSRKIYCGINFWCWDILNLYWQIIVYPQVDANIQWQHPCTNKTCFACAAVIQIWARATLPYLRIVKLFWWLNNCVKHCTVILYSIIGEK